MKISFQNLRTPETGLSPALERELDNLAPVFVGKIRKSTEINSNNLTPNKVLIFDAEERNLLDEKGNILSGTIKLHKNHDGDLEVQFSFQDRKIDVVFERGFSSSDMIQEFKKVFSTHEDKAVVEHFLTKADDYFDLLVSKASAEAI